MPKGRNIIVIGTSAGGLDALDALIGQLPTDIPAAIFIIQHLSPENTGAALLHRLGKNTRPSNAHWPPTARKLVKRAFTSAPRTIMW